MCIRDSAAAAQQSRLPGGDGDGIALRQIVNGEFTFFIGGDVVLIHLGNLHIAVVGFGSRLRVDVYKRQPITWSTRS